MTVDERTLDAAERARYQALYCGLCRQLGLRHGAIGRMTLSYELTFLSMLLSAAGDLAEERGEMRCPAQPLRRCAWASTEATAYAADINLILAYYKAVDDWRDDHSPSGLLKSRAMLRKAETAMARWPRQRQSIREGLDALGRMERAGELNPDVPANCFGALLGDLFVMRPEMETAELLWQCGSALGRFLYLLDAQLDLKSDIRHGRYNPLTGGGDVTDALPLLIGESAQAMEALPLARDQRLLRNILYAGVWIQYKSKLEDGSRGHGDE